MTAAAVIERLQVRDLLGVVAAICRRCNASVEDAAGTSRDGDAVRARHAVWAALRVRPGAPMAFAAIGRLWDVDHKTVIYGVGKGSLSGESMGIAWKEGGYGLDNSRVELGNSQGISRAEAGQEVGNSRDTCASRAHSESGSSYSQLSNLKGNSEASSSCQGVQGGQAKEPGAKSSSNGLEQVTPIGAAKSKRRAPELPLPDDWAPTPDHYDLGRSRGIDVDAEAASFRAHAETHDRRAVRWGAAFRHWLLRAQPARTGSRTLVQRDDPTKRLWKIPEGF